MLVIAVFGATCTCASEKTWAETLLALKPEERASSGMKCVLKYFEALDARLVYKNCVCQFRSTNSEQSFFYIKFLANKARRLTSMKPSSGKPKENQDDSCDQPCKIMVDYQRVCQKWLSTLDAKVKTASLEFGTKLGQWWAEIEEKKIYYFGTVLINEKVGSPVRLKYEADLKESQDKFEATTAEWAKAVGSKIFDKFKPEIKASQKSSLLVATGKKLAQMYLKERNEIERKFYKFSENAFRRKAQEQTIYLFKLYNTKILRNELENILDFFTKKGDKETDWSKVIREILSINEKVYELLFLISNKRMVFVDKNLDATLEKIRKTAKWISAYVEMNRMQDAVSSVTDKLKDLSDRLKSAKDLEEIKKLKESQSEYKKDLADYESQLKKLEEEYRIIENQVVVDANNQLKNEIEGLKKLEADVKEKMKGLIQKQNELFAKIEAKKMRRFLSDAHQK